MERHQISPRHAKNETICCIVPANLMNPLVKIVVDEIAAPEEGLSLMYMGQGVLSTIQREPLSAQTLPNYGDLNLRVRTLEQPQRQIQAH